MVCRYVRSVEGGQDNTSVIWFLRRIWNYCIPYQKRGYQIYRFDIFFGTTYLMIFNGLPCQTLFQGLWSIWRLDCVVVIIIFQFFECIASHISKEIWHKLSWMMMSIYVRQDNKSICLMWTECIFLWSRRFYPNNKLAYQAQPKPPATVGPIYR